MVCNYSVPIAVFVFNRPALAEKMLEILKIIRPKQLFIISDGAREQVQGEAERVEKVRAVFEHIDWPCEVYQNYSSVNMGCDNRIPSGISWVFEHVDRAVILEDDCIPDMQFFRYAEGMLEKYQYDARVMMISGSNFMQKYDTPYCCCFSARTYSWGWATWRRAWEYYCDDDRLWKQIQKNGAFVKTYPLRTRYYIKREFDYYFKRGKCPWDYLWWISCMSEGGLCAVPRVNLISNEGFGEEATHTIERGDYSGETYKMDFPLYFPDKVERNRQIDQLDRGLNPPWKIVKGWWKIKRKFVNRN